VLLHIVLQYGLQGVLGRRSGCIFSQREKMIAGDPPPWCCRLSIRVCNVRPKRKQLFWLRSVSGLDNFFSRWSLCPEPHDLMRASTYPKYLQRLTLSLNLQKPPCKKMFVQLRGPRAAYVHGLGYFRSFSSACSTAKPRALKQGLQSLVRVGYGGAGGVQCSRRHDIQPN
jgi:hypothetical protein